MHYIFSLQQFCVLFSPRYYYSCYHFLIPGLCFFSPLLIATYRYIGKNEVADEDDDWGDDGEDTGGIFSTYEDILRSQSISSRASLRHKM